MKTKRYDHQWRLAYNIKRAELVQQGFTSIFDKPTFESKIIQFPNVQKLSR